VLNNNDIYYLIFLSSAALTGDYLLIFYHSSKTLIFYHSSKTLMNERKIILGVMVMITLVSTIIGIGVTPILIEQAYALLTQGIQPAKHLSLQPVITST
jgi:hypothetical protein